jgi:hypothetical protein
MFEITTSAMFVMCRTTSRTECGTGYKFTCHLGEHWIDRHVKLFVLLGMMTRLRTVGELHGLGFSANWVTLLRLKFVWRNDFWCMDCSCTEVAWALALVLARLSKCCELLRRVRFTRFYRGNGVGATELVPTCSCIGSRSWGLTLIHVLIHNITRRWVLVIGVWTGVIELAA